MCFECLAKNIDGCCETIGPCMFPCTNRLRIVCGEGSPCSGITLCICCCVPSLSFDVFNISTFCIPSLILNCLFDCED